MGLLRVCHKVKWRTQMETGASERLTNLGMRQSQHGDVQDTGGPGGPLPFPFPCPLLFRNLWKPVKRSLRLQLSTDKCLVQESSFF